MDCRSHVDSASAPVQGLGFLFALRVTLIPFNSAVIEFLTHVQAKQPNLTTPLAEPVHLFESDEFETEFGLWELIKESGNLKENYSYQNGELSLKFTNDGDDFLGHLRQLDYQVNFNCKFRR